MPQRQAIQIPVDNNTSLVLEWYILRGTKTTYRSERGIIQTVFKLIEHVAKAFSWFTATIVRLFRRVDSFGKSEVDASRIEASHDYHLGIRIGSMNR